MAQELTNERIRKALVHLIDLAFCFENREQDTHDPRSESTLSQVVDLLEKHEIRRDALQEKGVEIILVEETAILYEQVVRGNIANAAELQEALIEAWDAWYRTLDESDLDELVLTADEIRERQGPKEAAVRAVASTIGVDRKTLYNREKQGASVMEPTAYGVRLGRLGVGPYLREIMGADIETSED